MPRIVIIGGGFGGLAAAKALRKAAVEVVLIDRRNFHLFSPLVYQVATAGLSPGDIASPIRWILRKQRNLQVWLGEATAIDPVRKVVTLADGEVSYDGLIVAAGARSPYFGHDAEWPKYAPGTEDDGGRAGGAAQSAARVRARRARDGSRGAAQAPDVRRRRRRPDRRRAGRRPRRDLAARSGARLPRHPSRVGPHHPHRGRRGNSCDLPARIVSVRPAGPRAAGGLGVDRHFRDRYPGRTGCAGTGNHRGRDHPLGGRRGRGAARAHPRR